VRRTLLRKPRKRDKPKQRIPDARTRRRSPQEIDGLGGGRTVKRIVEKAARIAAVSAAQLRHDLRIMWMAQPDELVGVWRIPCRHCHGDRGQFQFTAAEAYYIEQAYSYGEEQWPAACLTQDFGPEIYSFARAAYEAGREGKVLDMKGGEGYTRTGEINPRCSQCSGQGMPMVYIADTRKVSEGARRLFKGARVQGDRLEVVTIDRMHVMDLLARDCKVGVERKELVLQLPKTPDEFDQALKQMSEEELEQFIASMVTLEEGSEYHRVEPPENLPARR
jgi:phage terminase small subunit